MAGAGFKTFNTGDVLLASEVNTYLMQQTVMVFDNATARTAALGANVAEGMFSYLKDTNLTYRYDGSAWLSDAGTTSPLTTKGDLWSYSTTDARLAVGNNGETLVADSSATVGLRYSPTPSASNPVINGAFDIWQRGTSVSVAASSTNTYTADRWTTTTYANQAFTFARQATGDSTNLPNIQYCMRVQRNSGQTGTAANDFMTNLETANSIPFAGKTVTVSFYARKGANYSAASDALVLKVFTGTGTDQNVLGAGYTGAATPISSTVTLTATWQRFSATATLAATATEMAVDFNYTPVGTAGAADYYEVTGVQVDIGSVALPFRRAQNTLAGELAACQRYYYRVSGTTGTRAGTGITPSTTSFLSSIPFPVSMRVAPTALEQTGTASDYSVAYSASTVCSAVPTFWGASTWEGLTTLTVASGLTANQSAHLRFAGTAYLGWSAEL